LAFLEIEKFGLYLVEIILDLEEIRHDLKLFESNRLGTKLLKFYFLINLLVMNFRSRYSIIFFGNYIRLSSLYDM